MKRGFRAVIMSDYDYEDLLASINFDGVTLAYLSQEEGFELLKISFFYPFDKEVWTLKLDEFLDVLKKTKNKLWDFRDPEKKVMASNQVNDILCIDFDFKKKTDANGSRVLLICNKQNIFGDLFLENNKIILRIYSNYKVAQNIEVIQWMFLYDNFISVLTRAKEALLQDN
jgi:hypothetical protein